MYDEEAEENLDENTLGIFLAEWDENNGWNEDYDTGEEMWGANYPSESEEESDSLDFPALYTREEVEELYPHIFEIQKPIGYTYYPGELEQLYSQNIRIRQVIAGQPYTRGNG